MADVVCGEEKAAGSVRIFGAEQVNAGEGAKKQPDREGGAAIGDVAGDAGWLSHEGW